MTLCDNLTELFNQRESDMTIQFIVKYETTGKTMETKDVTGNAQKER